MFLYTINVKDSKEKIKQYIELGAKNYRINFGRKSISENIEQMKVMNKLSNELSEIKLFFDLPGHKIRFGKFEAGKVSIKENQIMYIKDDIILCSENQYSFKDEFYDNYQVGDILLLSSGLTMEVVNKSHKQYIVKACSDGEVYSFCGISVSNRYLIHDRLLDEELNILKRISNTHEIKFDYVCPSFTDTAEIIDEIRNLLTDHKFDIIAKIESPIGVSNLSEIAEKADGIMLCRGDLSSFYTANEIYDLGIKMSNICEEKNKIFIVATDFFNEFVSNEFISDNEISELYKYIKLNPNYVLINETSYVNNWQVLVETCQKIDRGEIINVN